MCVVLLAVARPTTVHARLPLGVSVTTLSPCHCHAVTPASLPEPHLPPHATFIAFLSINSVLYCLRPPSDHFIWVINSFSISLSLLYLLPSTLCFFIWQPNRYSRVYGDWASSLITLWLGRYIHLNYLNLYKSFIFI